MTERDGSPQTPVEEALARVEGHLRDGDIPAARRMLAAARKLVGSPEGGRADTLDREIARRERVLGPSAAFEAARGRRDWVAARAHAARAAELAEGEEAAAWRQAREQVDALIQAEWRLSDFEVDIAADRLLAECAGELHTAADVPARSLAENGNTLVLASAYARWVFVREVDIPNRRVTRLGWLRAPESIEGHAPAQVDDGSIHLVGRSGSILQLSRRPLDVLRWTSLRPFMLPDRGVDNAFVVPPGRFVWALLKEPIEDQAVTVVDLAEWRVCRRPATNWFHPVAGAGPARLLGTTLDEPAALFDERGLRLQWEPPAGCRALAAHPGGSGWVALVAVPEADGDPGDAPLGIVDLRPVRPAMQPLILPGSDEGAPATLATSAEHSLTFVLTYVSGSARIFAYATGSDGLEPIWDHEVGGRAALAQDCGGRRVLAIAATRSGLDLALLERRPPRLRATAEEQPSVVPPWAPLWYCTPGARGEAFRRLSDELRKAREEGGAARWVEKLRREHRRDPGALARLADVLARSRQESLAEGLLAFALERHPRDPQLRLVRATLEGVRGRWGAVEECLHDLDPADLTPEQACHWYHLAGMARLHANDAEAARRHFRAGQRLEPGFCNVAWNLAVSHALLDPIGATRVASGGVEEPAGGPAQSSSEGPTPGGSELRHVIQACRRADACFAAGDAAGARDALDTAAVFRTLELQSAARLAEAHLALDPKGVPGLFRKAVALARLACVDLEHRSALTADLPGLGWDRDRIAAVAQRARDWLESFDQRPVPEVPLQTPEPPSASPPPSPPSPAFPDTGPGSPDTHSLPPVGHESIRSLVPGLDALVRETARYVRALPGWDDRQTLGDDLTELAPVRRFLAAQGPGQAEQLRPHLDYCVNFEIHRRKLFHTDASLTWMLAHTSLAIEGAALRLPFPCFGLVFTDRATLELAEALPVGNETPSARVEVMTAYVKRIPAPDGRSAMGVSLVLDARDGRWPRVHPLELSFGDDDDLDDILDCALAQHAATKRVGGRVEARPLVHLVLNAVLYATSADVPWPVSQSPGRRLRSQAHGLGRARQARIARRVRELRQQHSDEDVFYLPGRISISQLRLLQHAERGAKTGELMARFMVRGHWRRAARGWRDQRVRWIEPYWKGPDLAAIIEREYKLEV